MFPFFLTPDCILHFFSFFHFLLFTQFNFDFLHISLDFVSYFILNNSRLN